MSQEKFKIRTRTKVLFGLMFALLLGAVLIRFNFANAQVRLLLQVGLILLVMVLGLLEIHRINLGLQRLAKVAELIGGGAFETRAESGTGDALGLVGKAINTMAGQIETSIKERERSQAELVKSKEALDRQNEQLSRAFDQQARFGEFLADLASIDINTLANKSLGHLMTASHAQLGAFYLFEPAARRLVCLNAQGLDRSAVKYIAQENNLDGLPGEVFTQQKWLFVESDEKDGALPTLDLGVARAQVRCIFGIPLMFRDAALGVIVLASLTKPDRAQVELLRNHVDALANGLNNALSYKAINHQSVLLEKANDELRKADQLRSEFVANMSHELRTPLNSIIGFSGIMLKNKAGTLDEADLKRAEKIHRNGKNLLHLINDILDLSKIEAGRMEVTFGPTRLCSLFHEVADLLHPQAEAKNIALKLELPASDLSVETDEQKLRQVVINLAGNAIKFTREGSVILRLLPTPEGGGGAVLQVEDTGIGIPQHQLEAIFEAFRQADSSTTREFGGTGLGLTISRSLVQLLGGTLTVTSQEGKGSVFSIRLPGQLAVPASPSPAAPEESQASDTPAARTKRRETHQSLTAFIRKNGSAPTRRAKSPSLIEEYREVLTRSLPIKAGQKILVVDDDPDARELISQFVQDLGAKAVLCASPTAATRIAVEEKPDLITLDLMMPEKSGWEVLSSLKGEPMVSGIPVIIISIVADRRKAISLGAVDALTKPIIRSEFNASVERNLRAGLRQLGKVLIVEDDPDACNLMSAWLESEVSELKSAPNGREALALLDGFRPDVIFLDLQMPIMDGPTFLEHLRADPRFTDLPVIVITAKALEQVERKKIEPQVSKILSKGEVFAQREQ